MTAATQTDCDNFLISPKIPDNDLRRHRITLRPKPSNSNYDAWQGNYLCGQGYLYTISIMRHRSLNRWSAQIMHKSRQFNEIILCRIDNAPHYDKVTKQRFRSDTAHIHVFLENWAQMGYDDHIAYAFFPDLPIDTVSDGWIYIRDMANVQNTRFLIAERLI